MTDNEVSELLEPLPSSDINGPAPSLNRLRFVLGGALLLAVLAWTGSAHSSASFSRALRRESAPEGFAADVWADDEAEGGDGAGGVSGAIGLAATGLAPNCPVEAVELTQTTGAAMLERAVKKSGGRPDFLILSCGTRQSGVENARQAKTWAREHGFY
uniref:Uncharacterized protein n=1 Tax=Pyrodinium bahamense TaxID=73915 RepID=A0A7S0B731_9DINO